MHLLQCRSFRKSKLEKFNGHFSSFFQSSLKTDITSSVLYVGGQPQTVILDYEIYLEDGQTSNFRLYYHPHLLDQFNSVLKRTFGDKAPHDIYGDFQPLADAVDPGFFIHMIEKV